MNEDEGIALPDHNVPKEKIKTDLLGLNKEYYFNSGVMLMDLGRIREKSAGSEPFLARAVKYIVSHNSALPDEEFLNSECIGDAVFVGRRYNADPGDEQYDDPLSMKRIWHFGGHAKPWNAFSGSNADILYWHYLTHTAWRDELISSMFSAGTNEEYYHRHNRGCIKRLKNQMKENLRHLLKRVAG